MQQGSNGHSPHYGDASLSAVGLSHSDIDWAGPLQGTPSSPKSGRGAVYFYTSKMYFKTRLSFMKKSTGTLMIPDWQVNLGKISLHHNLYKCSTGFEKSEHSVRVTHTLTLSLLCYSVVTLTTFYLICEFLRGVNHTLRWWLFFISNRFCLKYTTGTLFCTYRFMTIES